MSEHVSLGDRISILPYKVDQSPHEAAEGARKRKEDKIGAALWHDDLGPFFIVDDGVFENITSSRAKKRKASFRDFADVFRHSNGLRDLISIGAKKKLAEYREGRLPNLDGRVISAIAAYHGRSLGVRKPTQRP